jgi:universal stress protein A
MPRYKKLLTLVDLSNDSDSVAQAARDLAATFGAAIVILHVVEYIPIETMGESLMPAVQFEDEMLGGARDRLEKLVARLGLEHAAVRVEAGNTKAEILRVAADESADLIVLGSHERHGLAILLNQTEDTVLHAAHCDVLAIRLK